MVAGADFVDAAILGFAVAVVRDRRRAFYLHVVLEAVPVWCLTRSFN